MTTMTPIGAYPHIVIQYDEAADPTFGLVATEALKLIDSKNIGHRMLTEIQAAPIMSQKNYKVCIMKLKASGPGGQLDGSSKTVVCSYKDAWFQNEANNVPGVGTPSAVKWISAQWTTPDGNRPPFIGLAHELVHAWNNALGTCCKDDAQNEKTVVGLLPTNNNPITENAIRVEHGLQMRTSYSGI
jgi:hypothetical protein